MIPDREFLERFYDKEEVEILWSLKLATQNLPRTEASAMVRRALHELWDNEADYIQNTHLITTKDRGVVVFRWNRAQRKFYEDTIQVARKERRPIRIIVTKARQMGFSTLIASWLFHQVDEHPWKQAIVVNFDDVNTAELFRKTDFLQTNSYCPRETIRQSKGVLEFKRPHGSSYHTRSAGSFEVGRSMTFQFAHATEIPLWPDPERTFVALRQSIPSLEGTAIIQEATARGAQGHHYQEWRRAERGESQYIPFFAPWYWDPEYTMPFQSDDHRRRFGRSLSPQDEEYQKRYGLTLEQMQWRRWKIDNDLNGDLRKWCEEYPASAHEAFMTTGSMVFRTEDLLALEQRCTPPLWIGDAFLQQAAP